MASGTVGFFDMEATPDEHLLAAENNAEAEEQNRLSRSRRMHATMNAWESILENLGEPDCRWPKCSGHINYKERMRLVSFLIANGVNPQLIEDLAGCRHIELRDESAKKHWVTFLRSCTNDENTRRKYWARDLISDQLVYLNGDLKDPAPPRVVVINGKNITMQEYETDAFAACQRVW